MGISLSKLLLTSLAATTLTLGTSAIAQQPGGGMGGAGMGGAMGGGAGMGGAMGGGAGMGAAMGGGMARTTQLDSTPESNLSFSETNGGLSDCFPNCDDDRLYEVAANGGDQIEKGVIRSIPELDSIGAPIALALLAGVAAVALEHRHRKSKKADNKA